jgi:hypothetical protein
MAKVTYTGGRKPKELNKIDKWLRSQIPEGKRGSTR